MKDALGSFAHSGKIFASHRPAVGGRTSVDILISSTIPSFSNPREMILGLRASRGVNWRCFRGARFQSRAIEDTFATRIRASRNLPEPLGASPGVPGASEVIPGASRSVPERPKASPERPRSLPERPRSLLERPGTSRSVPGVSLEPPGTLWSVPGASRSVPQRPGASPERPWNLPERPGNIPGASWSGFSANLGPT